MMSFLHPLIALGALGAAAPIIIHFFFRRKARDLDFSAMRYVLLSYKKVARKLLIQEYLLLAVRVLMAVVLPLALAVPLLSRAVQGVSRGERPLEAALVIDTSLSMTREAEGGSLLDLAREEAGKWLDGLRPGDRASVIDAARLKATPPSRDLDEVKDLMLKMEPSYLVARIPESISIAASQLSGLEEFDRAVIVFTDMQMTSWTRAVTLKERGLPVYIVDVAHALKPRNLAIGGLDIKWKSLTREEAAALTVKIDNLGESDFTQTLVKLEFGAEAPARGFVDVPAGQSVEKIFHLTEIPEGPGLVRLQVDDGMEGDNVRHLHLRGGQGVSALVVDGDPAANYLEAETYFLEQALNPRLYARSRINPRTVTVAELEKAELADYQVLVLANAPALKPALTERIRAFVEGGGGLLFTLGDRVDADAYNAAWGDLLPRELRGVKQPYAGSQGEGEVRVMHLETPTHDDVRRHPALAMFANPAEGDLGIAGFSRYFLMQQETMPRSKVVLRLTDGTPIMVENKLGDGKVMVYASTADRAWSDMCIHPTFLPLMQQTVQYLADALVKGDAGELSAGNIVEIPVASDVRSARIRPPEGPAYEAELIDEQEDRRIRLTDTERPGVYVVEFKSDSERGKAADQVVVLNPDPRESDLAAIKGDRLEAYAGGAAIKLLKTGEPMDGEVAVPEIKTPYAFAFLWILAALALAERALTRKG